MVDMAALVGFRGEVTRVVGVGLDLGGGCAGGGAELEEWE